VETCKKNLFHGFQITSTGIGGWERRQSETAIELDREFTIITHAPTSTDSTFIRQARPALMQQQFLNQIHRLH